MLDQLKFVARRNRRVLHTLEDGRTVECSYRGTMTEGVLTESWEFRLDGVPCTEETIAALG